MTDPSYVLWLCPEDSFQDLFSVYKVIIGYVSVFLDSFTALRPEDVINFLNGAFNQARELYTAFEHSTVTKTPIVTVCF